MRLKELRKAHNLSQKELADILGYKQNTISNWESEKRAMDTETLIKIADYFGVSADTLLGRRVIDSKCGISSATNSNNKQILTYYQMLNDLGKREAVKRVAELTQIPQYAGDAMPIAAHNDKRLDNAELDLMRQDIDDL